VLTHVAGLMTVGSDDEHLVQVTRRQMVPALATEDVVVHIVQRGRDWSVVAFTELSNHEGRPGQW
jgi:hypothetical protein